MDSDLEMTPEKKTDNEMAEENEFEDLKTVIASEVTIFKTIWDEVEKQFSEAPAEVRSKIFETVAPYIGDMIAFAETEECCVEEDEKKEKKKKKKK